jgi:hypothetical protein
VPDYQNLTDDEVLQLALEREQLTDDARLVLDSELVHRRLSIKDIESHRIGVRVAQKREESQTAHRVFNQNSFPRPGFGTALLGKRNLRRDPSERFEEYEATQWVIAIWLPIFPIGTFTVRRGLSRWLGMARSDPVIIQRQARDWEQILLTWVKAAAVLLAMRITWLFLIYHPELIRRLLK